MRMFIGNDFATVFSEISNALLNDPEHVSAPRGQTIHEVSNAVVYINNPENNLFINPVRSTDEKYLRDELQLYFAGRRDLEGFEKASKFWGKLSDDGETVNSAYGYLIFQEKNEHGKTEWQWAYDSLINDKDSRQALIRFNKPTMSYDGNKDFVCTLNAIFDIRDDKLNLTVYRRSQDVHFGLPYDMAWESLMQQNMLLLLREKYPDLQLGSYTLHCKSLHMYERNFGVYEEANQKQFLSAMTPRMVRPIVDAKGDLIEYESDDAFTNWLYYSE
jgi:thymidylate synthase